MTPAPLVRLLTSGLFLAGALGVLALGTALAFQGIGSGRAGAWLLAWGLVFAALLPTGAVVLVALALVARGGPTSRTVPRMGRTVPERGQ